MPIKIKGYHGTKSSSAEVISTQQRFIPSSKDTEWLGGGVYFFAYKRHAEEWAQREAGKPKNVGEHAVVLSANLKYEESQLLDLDDPEQLDQVNELLRKTAAVTSGISGSPKADMRAVERHRRWCLACNLYRRLNRNIKVTSYTFFQKNGKDGFPYTQRQICVSDPNIISSIKKEG